MEDAYAKTTEEVLNYFNVSERLGLSQEEVKQNKKRYGPNGKYCNLFLVVVALLPCLSIQESVLKRALELEITVRPEWAYECASLTWLASQVSMNIFEAVYF